MKRKNKQNCKKSICIDKTSYKLTRVLLDELYNNSKLAKQDPLLELLILCKDNIYYKLSCKVEKIKVQ